MASEQATGNRIYPNIIKKFDIRVDIAYVGYAYAGSATGKPVWTIKRVNLAAGIPATVAWTAYQKAVWDQRELATYF